MPCTYDETPQELAEAEAKAKARRNRELNKVTALLCKLSEELVISEVPGLRKWLAEHKKRDAKRKSK